MKTFLQMCAVALIVVTGVMLYGTSLYPSSGAPETTTGTPVPTPEPGVPVVLVLETP